MSKNKQLIESLFAQVDVMINGNRPWDIQVYNDKFYSSLLTQWELAFGESYMSKWWDCPSLDQLIYKVLRGNLAKISLSNPAFWQGAIKQKFFDFLERHINLQSRERSLEVGKKHYSVGNELFKYMLDERMIYSCAFWENAKNLDEAQENKLKISLEKLDLQKNMTLLDIGCGWGGLAKYAAEHYEVNVVGISISQAQIDYAKQYCKGLPVTIKFQDYRELPNLNQKFDRIISIGMFEHVGYQNYKSFMEVVAKCLKDDGIFLLHTICANNQKRQGSRWIETYIFPYGQLPSLSQITFAAEGLFVVEDCQNYGPNYDKTLIEWHHNINQHWGKLPYDETFQRMWNYYLLSCAGSFRARQNQVWQIVLTKHGLEKRFSFR